VATTWSLGVLNAMYTSADVFWMTLSSRPARSCCPLADLRNAMGGPHINVCRPGARVSSKLSYFSCVAFLSGVSQSVPSWSDVGQGVGACSVLLDVGCLLKAFWPSN
jgi:hypothetical protein